MKKKTMGLHIGGHDYNILELSLEHEDSSKELYGRHLQGRMYYSHR